MYTSYASFSDIMSARCSRFPVLLDVATYIIYSSYCSPDDLNLILTEENN